MDEKVVARTVKLVAESLAVRLVVCVSIFPFYFYIIIASGVLKNMLLCSYNKETTGQLQF